MIGLSCHSATVERHGFAFTVRTHLKAHAHNVRTVSAPYRAQAQATVLVGTQTRFQNRRLRSSGVEPRSLSPVYVTELHGAFLPAGKDAIEVISFDPVFSYIEDDVRRESNAGDPFRLSFEWRSRLWRCQLGG